jgi:Protein of unknown function (DUF3575).
MQKELLKLLLLGVFTIMPHCLTAQDTQQSSFVLKSNLLSDVTTTMNLAGEVKLGNQFTLDASFSYNPWTFSENKKLKHLRFQPELRYWAESAYSGHFFGFHLGYMQYSTSGIKFPFTPLTDMKNSRYQGDAYGAGFSCGYVWRLSNRWNLEASLGVGYAYLDYDRYECKKCGEYIESGTAHYFGPTKAALSLIYVIK